MHSPRAVQCLRSFLVECERLLKHAEHHFERLHAHWAAADRAEMLLLVNRAALSPREGNVDQAFLMIVAGRPGEARDADRDIGLASLQGPLGHGPRDDFRYGLIELEQTWFDAEKL